MARFKIYSKDGKERYEGKPRYSGSYLKPSYLEFSEIASPEPISWEVGDYVDYPRTGMRYYLYSIPQPSKNARKGSHGRAFTYSNVQFHAATKELEIALFRDLVVNDNNIHFSTSPDVATTENVQGIADRIQVCMNDLYPGRWEIRVASLDATSEVDLTEPKDFALSGGTCLDALSKIYELWQDIGWIHTHENGKEVITIGYANRRIAENTSEPYLYGKGNGLTAIKKNQTNKDEFATRLYVYGSERNLPARYYNGKDILNAESVDIRNLMLPLDKWGTTGGLPDARKAYLENAEAVAKYGVIPKTHYFDSTEAGADIYPSITGMTVGQIRKVLSDMGQTEYSPDTAIYPDDAERVDEVLSAVNPTDDGVERKDGKRYEDSKTVDISSLGQTITIPGGTVPDIRIGKIFNVQFDKTGMGVVSMDSGMNFVLVGEGISSVKATYELSDASSASRKTVLQTKEVEGTQVGANASNWTIPIPAMRIAFEKMEYSSFPVYLSIDIYITPTSIQTERTANLVAPSYPVTFNFSRSLQSTFVINLKQIGFDINERASQGAGKKISMKSGKCEGREFVISNCRYDKDTDSWSLTCKRQRDDTLGMLFPYNQYEIASGDRFVLLDIALPDSYIGVAMERLLAEGKKLLARASRIQNNYEPSIDAKVMIESGRTLREGMYMEITDVDVVDNTTDYILIDSLSIYEDESAIPTYKATLRERRKVTYKGTPSATSETKTSSVDSGEVDASDVDLSGYATKTYVDDTLKPFADMFYWEEEGVTIGTKYNFFSEGQNAAGGIGEEEGGSGVGGGIIDEEMSDDSDNAVANRVIKAYIDALFNDFKDNPSAYIPLKTVNGMVLYGSGDIKIEGGSGEGTSGLTAINVNSQSFQPANGIVTLPDYRPLEYYNQDLAKKVDKVDGKGLSTNDYTTAEKNKLAGIAAGAEVNVQSDWNATSGDAFIKNKPTLSVVATSGSYSDLTNTPRFAIVATSGSYNDLSDKPTIPVEVTETTVAGWGFTKNTGTYIKPTTGIPKSHLASDVQTSLGLADTALQPSALDDYPTTTEVSKALEYYAKDADLESAVQRITTNETTINAHTSQISTLQGYFTNGKANNADKLDEHDSSYFATAANLNNLTSRVSTAEGEIDGLQEDNETLMAWYNAVGQHFMYDSVNEAWYLDGDFYATGQNAAGGVGEEEGSTGGGLDEDQLEEYLTTNKYVTQTWVSNQRFAKTADLGALAFKNSLAFSELASHPTTLSGYGITDGMHWIANMYKADTTYYRHAGYGYPAGGWNGSGPAIAFGISTYYARIQMGNDTETPYLYFNPTVNGTTASKWFRFLFDSGNHNIESDRFSIKGDLVLHRNTDDGDTYLNYGPHANDGASLVIYGQHVSVNATEYILLATPTIYQSIDGAWHNVLNDKNLPNYAYTKTLADETFFPLAGNKTITGYVSIEGEIKGKAISNPTNAAVTNQWRIIRADNALYLQVGTDAGDTAGTFHLTGYSGVAASHIRLHTAKATITGEIDVTGASLLRGAVTANSGMTVQSGITVLNGVSSFVGHTTFSGGITVDGEQAILGPTPSGGTYPRFRVFPHPSGFYFQAATFDGISREGIVRFSGMQGVNAAEVHFRSNSTMFTGSLKVDGQVGTFSQIIGLHSTGAYHRYRINQNSVGTFFQAGVNDGSKQQGTMYLSGIDNTMMTALHLRAEATTVYGSMSIPNAPLTLGSTLSVSGQATLSGGAFLPPSKTIRFQDAQTETFSISFDSEVGGLNLSGATRTLGLASFQKGIQIEYGQSIAFVDKDGNKQCITLDEANGAIKVIGNFFATGQNAAGGAGGEELGMLTSWDNIPTNLEGVTLSASLGIDLYNNSKKVLTSWDDAPTDLTGYTVSAALVQTMNDKITELESMGGGAENILIKVNALSAYDGRTITTNAMQTLTGLSVDVAQKMLQGAYNKVIDNSGDYPEVWDYTARGTSTGIIVYLRIGDGYDTNTAYALTYTQSAANWSIIMGEI